MLGWALNLGFAAGPVLGDTTAPILSLPTGEATGSTTASGTVTTDEAGTLYFWATESASEAAADIKTNGDSQVATTGIQNVFITGLTANTDYYIHYVEDDATSNESNVVSSGLFTTEEISIGGSYFPPKRVKTKLRKKDEEILKQVYEIVSKLEEVPKTKKLVERAEKIEVKAKKAIQLKDFTEHDRQIKVMSNQIDKLSTAVTLHIQAVKRDEEEAIKALLSIL